MDCLFHRMFLAGRWWLALVLTIGLVGCKTWGTHEDSLRDNGLSSAARKARPDKKKDDKDKDAECWGLSDKSRQIERDLSGP